MKSHDDALDQKVNDLRERMRLLQMDRRANVEVMEANKASTSSEIRSLRDENKRLRLKLTQLQKRLLIDRGAKDELSTCHKESVQLRTQYDSLKVKSTKYQRQLEKLKDEAKLCELESQVLDGQSGPISKEIKTIENK
jgi:chromosome segregation ATPase